MKKYIKKTSILLVTLAIFAILLRIMLLNWSLQFPNNGDFIRYQDWARIAHVYSLADSYSSKHLSFSFGLPNNQPPGSLYILSGSYESYVIAGKVIARLSHTAAGSNFWINTSLQTIFLKIPFLLADILMGFFAYMIVLEKNRQGKAILAASIIWFCPILFYNSALWGQMDSLNNLFFMISLLFAFKKKVGLSILCIAISLYIKFSLLPLIPFYFFFLYFSSGKNLKSIILSTCLSAVLVVVATFPISTNPILWLSHEIPLIAKGELQNITSAAFNFWYMVTCSPFSCPKNVDVGTLFLGIRYDVWGYFLFAATTLPILYFQLKKNIALIEKDKLFLALSLVALMAFIFLPKMHDRYMYPVFPLLAVAISTAKSIKQLLATFLLLAFVGTINIYYSWFPTHYPSVYIYYLLGSKVFTWLISITTVIVAVWFYILALVQFKKVA